VAYFAEKLPIPFFCIDFLHDGERFWLSELELDGVILPDGAAGDDRSIQRDVARARFAAYRDAHTAWLEAGK
jgi:hypothetical protein